MDWQPATLISNHQISADVYSLTFEVDNWVKHLPGQHYDIRLTAENGYSAQRSYSIASSPDDQGVIEFGVQLLEDGEVSPYLTQILKKGEQIEVKGPLGGHFIWDINMPGSLLMIAGGSGVVPFMSMIRHYLKYPQKMPRSVILLLSAQDIDHIPYYQELMGMTVADPTIRVFFSLTRKVPKNWPGYQRRIDREIIAEVFGAYIMQIPMIFVCGSTPFVEIAAINLVEFGFNSHFIKTERFGG